ncbi:hypothetical protein [Sphaerisporangium sp. TRM90804]|uniref:hypothetical protein n=1 Tax=Sphaerisporangium sp. TRM90804 TaxID=3031113 RepID=UPI002449671C|nr:hypothetical protein [Sphaerisporangium sp. TRM90804]MDH2425714.1 hypothetical protein [Sphaerisporangium sp. TRM90804]
MTWRRQLAYGLGLLVLVPAVIAAAVLPWREKYEVRSGKGGREVVASQGRAATLDGVEWRLKSITEGRLQEEFSRPLPPRTKIAVVVVSATPRDARASAWFARETGSCKIYAADGAGRVWERSFRTDLAPDSPHAVSCQVLDEDYTLAPVPVGKEHTIQAEYVVPADAFSDLRVEVRLSPDRATVRLAP